jgi:thioredoxin reductase
VTTLSGIPGAGELAGKGIYQGMPADVPQAVRDRHAVVVGEPADCAAAATQLGDAGWTVTIVMSSAGCRCRMHRDCRRRLAAAVVCVSGVEYLEAVVLRRIDTGRIEACNASALFIL